MNNLAGNPGRWWPKVSEYRFECWFRLENGEAVALDERIQADSREEAIEKAEMFATHMAESGWIGEPAVQVHSELSIWLCGNGKPELIWNGA